MADHRWEDVSYHGSPIWQCDFCGLMRYDPKAAGPCVAAERCLAEEARRAEDKERYEYEELVRRRERERYLDEKYGGE